MAVTLLALAATGVAGCASPSPDQTPHQDASSAETQAPNLGSAGADDAAQDDVPEEDAAQWDAVKADCAGTPLIAEHFATSSSEPIDCWQFLSDWQDPYSLTDQLADLMAGADPSLENRIKGCLPDDDSWSHGECWVSFSVPDEPNKNVRAWIDLQTSEAFTPGASTSVFDDLFANGGIVKYTIATYEVDVP